MDSNKIPTAVYLDFSKAFDTLSFEILLNKLKYYGFTDVALKLINSYLTGRTQYVTYKDLISEKLTSPWEFHKVRYWAHYFIYLYIYYYIYK